MLNSGRMVAEWWPNGGRMVAEWYCQGGWTVLSTLLDTIHLLNGYWMVIDLLNGWTGRDLEGGGGAGWLALARG